MTPSSALVLGWTGFIGGHLAPRLAADGVEVHVPVIAKRSHPDPPAGCRGIEIDRFDPAGAGRLMARSRPEVIYNLAAAGVQQSEADPGRLSDGNAGIVRTLLDACDVSDPPLVIHAGSWSEYAESDLPMSEEHPLEPRSVYGLAKLEASRAGAELAAERGTPFVVMRLFNVYGPGERPHRLLPHIVTRLTSGRTARLTPGDQQRDFVHVFDVIDALMSAAATPGVAEHDAYNVCTGRGTSIADFARMVADALGEPHDALGLGLLPPRADEPPRAVGDPTRLAGATGWRASIPVDAGIPDTVRAITETRGS